jgi:hypothetical protein
MDIIFSRHARRQMKWRKITEIEVKTVIDDPDTVADTIQGRKNAWKVTEGRIIKITYKPEDGRLTIITAIVKGE